MRNRLTRLFGGTALGIGAVYYLLITAAIFAAVFPAGFILWQLSDLGAGGGVSFSAIWASWVDSRHLSASENSILLAGLMSFTLGCGSCFLSLGIRFGEGERAAGPILYGCCFLPLLIPDYVVGVAGRVALDPTIGLLAHWLPEDILIDRFLALVTTGAVASLKWLPVMFVIVDSSVEALGREKLYQARLDYESFGSAARYVYIPQMKNSIVVVSSLGFLIGFRQQQLAYELTSGGGGFAAETWPTWNHRVLFEFADVSQGASQAIFGLLLLVMPILLIRAFAAGLHRHDV